MRVLIVDDRPAFRRVAGELLAARGYAVAGEAVTPVAALEAAALLATHAA